MRRSLRFIDSHIGFRANPSSQFVYFEAAPVILHSQSERCMAKPSQEIVSSLKLFAVHRVSHRVSKPAVFARP